MRTMLIDNWLYVRYTYKINNDLAECDNGIIYMFSLSKNTNNYM